MIKQNGGGICWHEVGTGKTMIMCVAAYEMKRLGLAQKPLIIALKANVHEIADTFRKAYPGAKVLYPGKEDFTPANRKRYFPRSRTTTGIASSSHTTNSPRYPSRKRRCSRYSPKNSPTRSAALRYWSSPPCATGAVLAKRARKAEAEPLGHARRVAGEDRQPERRRRGFPHHGHRPHFRGRVPHVQEPYVSDAPHAGSRYRQHARARNGR